MISINKTEGGKDQKWCGAWESVFLTSSLTTADVQGPAFGKRYMPIREDISSIVPLRSRPQPSYTDYSWSLSLGTFKSLDSLSVSSEWPWISDPARILWIDLGAIQVLHSPNPKGNISTWRWVRCLFLISTSLPSPQHSRHPHGHNTAFLDL